MNTQRKHITRNRGARITLVSLIAVTSVVACGGDDDQDSASTTDETGLATGTTAPGTTEPAGTTVPVTTASGTTAPVTTASPNITPVAGISNAETFVDPTNPTCTYRNLELISRATAGDIQTVVGGVVDDLGRVTPDDSEIAVDLHLYGIDVDPLLAAVQLANQGIEASPNYIYAFAPGWQYSPYDDPESTVQLVRGGPLSTNSASIAVLDTGWVPTTNGTPAATTTTTTSPGIAATAPPEVLDGRAAGHGTFIVNLLGQLLPAASFVAGGIESRYTTDDNYELSDSSVVSIRDDYSVTRALAATVGGGVEYLNMSFGSYGCTALHDGNAEQEEIEPYYTPLGVRTVMKQLDGSGLEAFAASGNDGRDGSTPEIFYPAGWAPLYDWLHSVASDPKDGVDYSNRGTWVETQARGSKTVSLLPATNQWGSPDHWAAWSGTSFATPCALAMSVAGQFVEYDAFPSGPDFMECGLNLR